MEEAVFGLAVKRSDMLDKKSVLSDELVKEIRLPGVFLVYQFVFSDHSLSVAMILMCSTALVYLIDVLVLLRGKNSWELTERFSVSRFTRASLFPVMSKLSLRSSTLSSGTLQRCKGLSDGVGEGITFARFLFAPACFLPAGFAVDLVDLVRI